MNGKEVQSLEKLKENNMANLDITVDELSAGDMCFSPVSFCH